MDIVLPTQDLDYSRKVTGKDIDISIPDQKFALYDYCVTHNLFKEPKQKDYPNRQEFLLAYQRTKDAWALLDDNTIYAYAYLKFNGKLIKLYPFQDIIINDKHKRIDVESSNQIGKSFLLCVRAVIDFLRDPGKNYIIGLISKSMPQNSYNMRVIKQILKSANIEFDPGDHDSMTVTTRNIMKKENGAITDIISHTITLVCSVAGTSSLGFPFDLELLDEFEFWENPEGIEYMYDQIFQPRTYDTKGQIIIFSNPNGINFVSENLQKRKLKAEVDGQIIDTDELEFHIYNFHFMDKPGNTLLEWEQKKSTMHPIIFSSTMAAERTESQAAALTRLQIQDSYDLRIDDQGIYGGKDRECYFFLDVGSVHDQSVLIGLYLDRDDNDDIRFNMFYQQFYPITYPLWRVVGVDPNGDMKFNLNDGWGDRLELSVAEILDQYKYNDNRPLFGVDVTGHAAISPLCRAAGVSPIDITFSGPKKAAMYERFITLMAKRLVRRGKTDNWYNGINRNWEMQATTLQIRTKSNKGASLRYPLYHHMTETDLDDAIDATVGCINIADTGMTPQIGVNIISDKKRVPVEGDDDYDEEFEKQRMKQHNNRFDRLRFDY